MDGKLSEEILGQPVYSRAGHTLDMYFRNDEFWMTPGEALNSNNESHGLDFYR